MSDLFGFNENIFAVKSAVMLHVPFLGNLSFFFFFYVHKICFLNTYVLFSHPCFVFLWVYIRIKHNICTSHVNDFQTVKLALQICHTSVKFTAHACGGCIYKL